MSILRPSSASVWGVCPGSVLHNALNPAPPISEEQKSALAEGVAAHTIAEELVRCQINRPAKSTYVGRRHENGVVYTGEMFEAAKLYADDVLAVQRETRIFGGPNQGIEKTLPARSIGDECNGTPDYYLYDEEGARLYLWDFKNGRKPVDVCENPQLIVYASAVLDDVLGDSYGVMDTKIWVDFRIVQPNATSDSGVNSWGVWASDLRAPINKLKFAAENALSDDPDIRTGPHCVRCASCGTCSAFLKSAENLFAVVTKLYAQTVPAPLETRLDLISMGADYFNKLKQSVEEEARHRLKTGGYIPGYTMGYTRPSTVWVPSDEFVLTLGETFGVDLQKEKKPITPKQAIAKGIPKETIEQYTEKRDGKQKVQKINFKKIRSMLK